MLIMYGAGAYKRLWRYFNEKDYLVCGLAMMVGQTLRIKVLVSLKKEYWFNQTFRSAGLQLLVFMQVLMISVIG